MPPILMPRKKFRCKGVVALPFPLLEENKKRKLFRAKFQEGKVYVEDAQDAISLWQNGYFGHLSQNLYEPEKKHSKTVKVWHLEQHDGLQNLINYRMKDVDDTVKLSEENEMNEGIKSYIEKTGRKNKQAAFSEENCFEKNVDILQNIETINEKSLLDEIEDVSSWQDLKECDANECTILLLDQQFERNDDVNYASSLLLEEAMFLSYALGCLVVSHNGHWLSIDDMWTLFTLHDKQFVTRYTVYHHFRIKKWIVKSGLKFGAEFVLYPIGPPFYHSQFTVMTQCVWDDTFKLDDASIRRFDWTALAAVERLNNHVAKTPLICVVVRPRNLTSTMNISCLQHLYVCEFMLSRWVPKDESGVKGSQISALKLPKM